VPARPSGKDRFSEVKAFGSGEGLMESGARREVEQGLTAFVHNFEFCYSKAESRLNNIEVFSPYREENTTPHHYKDQLVNAV
jgi:hypothetical protein